MERYPPKIAVLLRSLAEEAMAWTDCQQQNDGSEADARHGKMGLITRLMEEAGGIARDVCMQLQDVALTAAATQVTASPLYKEDFRCACVPQPACLSKKLWADTLDFFQVAAKGACARGARGASAEQPSLEEADRLMTLIAGSHIESVPDPLLGSKGACHLRIIAINDVYELNQLSRVKTLVIDQKKTARNVVTTLAGDFVGPSLLSSLDAGHGMIRVLNSIPVDYVCFGNHETDIPYTKLVQRISEFQGTWLNSNMPDFRPELAERAIKRLVGEDGTSNARLVAFLGFCIGGGKFGSTYRADAFGGAHKTMIPVVDASNELEPRLRDLYPDLDEIVPITHQDLQEDVVLAESGKYPVIVAGHDHEVTNTTHGSRKCPVVKAGMDAQNAAIIDLVWTAEQGAPPQVNVSIKPVSDYAPDPRLEQEIERIHRPVHELEEANLYELTNGETLTSNGVKFGDASMARLVASAIRDCLGCDAAVVNSGAVRGKKDYDRFISYGDLKKECPYPTSVVSTQMPFEVLRDAIRESRRPWWDIPEGGERLEGNSAFQVDDGIALNAHHVAETIGGRPPDHSRLYSVACDVRYLKKNPVLNTYCEQFPERVQPEDAGRPVLPILVEYFCGRMWAKLAESFSLASGNTGGKATPEEFERFFQELDADHSGSIDHGEIRRAVQTRLGDGLSSRIIVDQMLSLVDGNGDGAIDRSELRQALAKCCKGFGT
eukprot:TRINITY_DN7454_c2_g2_i2.p1 TRINITY_DN7454_c2_g2~~TRINITY_DN7454_c2_g2_i2.p1  ORF type:complete len:718 (-),score=99.36 TRINITY_DN7454_c2_g2_i2:76-2229(-)